uniref:Cadherin domain-containing protein n=1 Tax=Plectus sambesii TaxID=2011161 RepID=A0A914VHK3_9BILA
MSSVFVIVTAESSIDPNNKVSRPLRIEIADADDNVPDFGQDQGSLPIVFMINAEDTTGWTNESMHMMMVGKVHAEDVDLPPFDIVNYYLLPHCDNEDGIFDINQTSGEIFVSAPLPEEHRATYQLCVLASPLANQTTSIDIQFSSKNKSMIHVIVKVMKPMADTERDHRPTIQFMNNSIITMGSGFVDAMIPISAPIMGGKELKYELKDVAFKPAEAETNVTNSMNAFVVDPHTGDVRVAADLDGTSEGIYTLNLVAKEKATDADYAHLVAKVYHIHDSSRLKYVFEAPVDSLGSSLTHFTQAVQQTINQTNDQLHLVFDRPQVYHWKSPQRSSVCFHATNNDDVLLSKGSVLTMLAGLAGNDSELTQVYLQYKVINIEMCESPVIVVDKDDQYQTQIFWWIFAVFLSILILSALTCYLCFLGRYKQYMIGMPKAEDQQTIAPKVQRPHMLAITNGPPEPHFLSKNNPLPFAGY